MTLTHMDESTLFEMIDPAHHATVRKWLDRRDGVAVYENQALDSSNLGHRKFTSYGSTAAQLEVEVPPERLPDIGGQINWAYRLTGTCRRNLG